MTSLCPRSVLITEANRGLGLEFLRQFLKLPKPPQILIATCRDPEKAESLQDLARQNSSVRILKLDAGDPADMENIINEAEHILQGQGLNMLLNNTGNCIPTILDETDGNKLIENYRINAEAPMLLIKTLLPFLKKAANTSSLKGLSCNKAAIINISSIMGSIEHNIKGGRSPYRASKAALNMVTKSLSVDLLGDEILVTGIHPGWVQTDMGGPNATLQIPERIERCLRTFVSLDKESTGLVYNYTGTVLPY